MKSMESSWKVWNSHEKYGIAMKIMKKQSTWILQDFNFGGTLLFDEKLTHLDIMCFSNFEKPSYFIGEFIKYIDITCFQIWGSLIF